jgi:hypothetical protein
MPQYYIGNKTQCTNYDKQVSMREEYEGETNNWWTPVQLTNGKFAILKHENYSSILELVNEIQIKPINEF